MKSDIRLDDYMPTIKAYARVGLRKMRRPSIFSLDDMVQEGVIAFIRARDTDKKKSKFSTYLTTCIRNKFYSLMVKSFRIPSNDNLKPNRVFRHQVGSQAMTDHFTAMNKYRGGHGLNLGRTTRDVDFEDAMETLSKVMDDDETQYVTMIMSGITAVDAPKKMGISNYKKTKVQKSLAKKLVQLGFHA